MRLSYRMLDELAGEHGDAFYLVDLGTFRHDYAELLAAFTAWYPDTRLAYSYKTNYLPQLCRSVDELGGYAEVVSRMEYELAGRIGVPPERIIFNGPYKRPEDLLTALVAGAVVNLDASYEVRLVEGIGRAFPDRQLRVGLRCNLEAGGHRSRFGFDTGSPEFEEAVARLTRLDNCRLVGFHCHSSADRGVEAFAQRTYQVLTLTAKYFPGHPPELINIGGGFFSDMPAALRKQFGVPVPTFREYGEAVARQVADAYPDRGPQLVIEPGTAIAANSTSFVARVVDVKTVGGRRIAVVAGSVHNVKPTRHGRLLGVEVHRRVPGRAAVDGPVDIVGYTCMEDDCLAAAYDGPLATGDYVVVSAVGAYTLVMKPPFIQPAPAVVTYDPVADRFSLARRRERTADVFATYVLD
jgi:diaminopimelate decarboxylase